MQASRTSRPPQVRIIHVRIWEQKFSIGSFLSPSLVPLRLIKTEDISMFKEEQGAVD